MVNPREIPLSLNKPELKLLYQRLGSSPSEADERLARILSDFYHRMSRDVLLGFFFDGKDVEAIASRQKEFLLRAMGAAPSYQGKPPAQAHENLAPILRGHFDRRLQILEATLRDHGLNAEDIRTWITFENAFREGIVREEGPLKRS